MVYRVSMRWRRGNHLGITFDHVVIDPETDNYHFCNANGQIDLVFIPGEMTKFGSIQGHLTNQFDPKKEAVAWSMDLPYTASKRLEKKIQEYLYEIYSTNNKKVIT